MPPESKNNLAGGTSEKVANVFSHRPPLHVKTASVNGWGAQKI